MDWAFGHGEATSLTDQQPRRERPRLPAVFGVVSITPTPPGPCCLDPHSLTALCTEGVRQRYPSLHETRERGTLFRVPLYLLADGALLRTSSLALELVVGAPDNDGLRFLEGSVESRFGEEAPRIEVERLPDGTAVVVLEGEFDLLNAEELEQRLVAEAGGPRGLVLDLSKVSFIDAATIHALKRTHETLLLSDQRLILQVGTPGTVVDRALKISGLYRELPCADDREKALRLASE
jgi:anti-anti-sigma factor